MNPAESSPPVHAAISTEPAGATVISYPLTAMGRRTRIVECGSGEKNLVLLHGAGSRADRFKPCMTELACGGWHVYAIDLIGHGFADKPIDFDYTALGLAEHVAAVLEQLALSRATLVGTSLGGHVAAHVASSHPDLVAGLGLVGSIGIVELPEQGKTPPAVVADGSPDGVRRKLNFLVSDPSQVTDAWVREESAINSSDGAREALLKVADFVNNQSNNDLQATRLAVAPNLDHPVLVVWGVEDRWTPLSMGEEVHAALPGSMFVPMPGCGHAPYAENPGRFTEIISNHFG